MDSRDVALQSVMPTVMVPRYSELEELDTPGNRHTGQPTLDGRQRCLAGSLPRMVVCARAGRKAFNHPGSIRASE